MKIKGIVFDKDGTLLDYERCWIPVAEGAVDYVLARHPGEGVRARVIANLGITEDGTVDIDGPLCRGDYAGIGMAFIDGYRDAGYEVSVEAMARDIPAGFAASRDRATVVPICPNLKELLRRLRDMGISLGLITSDGADSTTYTLSRLGVNGLFDVLLTHDDLQPAKPDPYFMGVFMQKTGLSPDEILMVGDTFADIDFGINSGTHTLGVGRSEKNRSRLAKKAEFIGRDISAVFDVIE